MRRLGLVLAFLALASPCWAFSIVGTSSNDSGNTGSNGCTASGTANLTNTCNVPSGTTNGELMIACMTSYNATPVFPSGWTAIPNASGQNNGLYAACEQRTASSEPVNYAFGGGSDEYATGWLTVISGSNNTVDIANFSGNNGASPQTISAPSITTTVNNDLLLTDCSMIANSSTTIAAVSGETQLSLIAGNAMSSGNTGNFGGYVALGSAGATGTKTCASTASATISWVGINLAVEPVSCSTLTQISICPEGRGANGVCDIGSDTIEHLTACYICPAGTPCVAHVTDAQSCSAGQTPTGSGSGNCSVAWNGSAWVAN